MICEAFNGLSKGRFSRSCKEGDMLLNTSRRDQRVSEIHIRGEESRKSRGSQNWCH